MTNKPIYLDNHATTPLDPHVLEIMMPYLTTEFGNPASKSHVFGWSAEKAVNKAREQVAKSLKAHPKEIVFTSGATESNNMALKGIARCLKNKGNHIVSSSIEHNAVFDSLNALVKEGFEVTYLNPDKEGLITVEDVKNVVKPNTILLSFMAANNEIGTLNPIKEIGSFAKKAGIIFHCDAVQGFGRIPFDVENIDVDLVSISGHKIYGPKGVGALYVKNSVQKHMCALIHGGGHERGMRSGTLNVAGIVGLGAACELVVKNEKKEQEHALKLRTLLHKKLDSALEHVCVNGSIEQRVPGNLNVSFAFVDGEDLMLAINNKVAVSASSACTSASMKASHVLKNLGVRADLVLAAIRFGIGRFNTEDEINQVADLIIDEVSRLRNLSPTWSKVKDQKFNIIQ
ncbi:aminotransferase class V-fold PLP-dependent enzyme [Sulfobacillus acidophilus]|uniref:cysteine desulfurase n=1 Tax=Sulfobacillus acidophilus TaxID=53633 RepID=A0ABS3AWR0_9FIRM|nr:aminotransferase class V-fold PLP-dependent enzyme [Sulfobacillus acidophilus]